MIRDWILPIIVGVGLAAVAVGATLAVYWHRAYERERRARRHS